MCVRCMPFGRLTSSWASSWYTPATRRDGSKCERPDHRQVHCSSPPLWLRAKNLVAFCMLSMNLSGLPICVSHVWPLLRVAGMFSTVFAASDPRHGRRWRGTPPTVRKLAHAMVVTWCYWYCDGRHTKSTLFVHHVGLWVVQSGLINSSGWFVPNRKPEGL